MVEFELSVFDQILEGELAVEAIRNDESALVDSVDFGAFDRSHMQFVDLQMLHMRPRDVVHFDCIRQRVFYCKESG